MLDISSALSPAAQIVSAHVANNAVTPEPLPKLISDVHRALTTAGQTPIEQPMSEPVVSVKKSVLADLLICLDCGKQFSMLQRHPMTDHKLTVDQSRQKWRLPSTYPMVSADCTKVRSALAKKSGLGRVGKAAKKSGKDGCTAEVIGPSRWTYLHLQSRPCTLTVAFAYHWASNRSHQ